MKPSIRRSVFREWRGGSVEPRPVETWRSASVVLEPLMHDLGLEERLWELQIIGAWREIVGDFLATHTQPVQLRGGELQVRVVQPSLRFELERSLKPNILRKLAERLGPGRIRNIRFGLL